MSGYNFGFDLMDAAPDKLTSVSKAHAEYGASSSERWMNCPGSISLSENAPEQSESPAALRGTKAHACLDFLIQNRKDLPNAIKKARKMKWEYEDHETGEWIVTNEIAFTEEMITHALEEIKWIEKKAKELGGKIESECKVDATWFVAPDQFGTLDVTIYRLFGTLLIYDYKYGVKEVEPEDNSQLIYYALAKAAEFDFNFVDVILVVGQPNLQSGNPRKEWHTTMDHLIEVWAPKYKKAVAASLRGQPKFSAGEHCFFCPAKTICKEYKGEAFKKAAIAFNDETAVVESLPVLNNKILPNLGNMLDACDRLESFIEQVRNHAFTVLKKGGTIKGYKLVDKRSTRKWTDRDVVSVKAKKAFGDKAFDQPSLKSPKQLEESFKGHPKLDQVKKWVEKHTTNESSGLTMVREDDKRESKSHIDMVFNDGLFAPVSEKKNKSKGVKKMNTEQTTTVETREDVPVLAVKRTVAKKAPAKKKPIVAAKRKTASKTKPVKKATKKEVKTKKTTKK